MRERLIQFDQDLFIYLNSLHTSWLDPVMFYMTDTYFWLPLHAFLLYLIFKVYGKRTWIVLICITLSVVAANGITSELMKPFFLRLRPSHTPHIENLVHIVNDYKGGLYGFASSHAANTFALTTFFWIAFRKHYRYCGWLFVWASLVTYTRIYLGVHYPADILVGALIGILCGWAGYQLLQLIMNMTKQKNEAA